MQVKNKSIHFLGNFYKYFYKYFYISPRKLDQDIDIYLLIFDKLIRRYNIERREKKTEREEIRERTYPLRKRVVN